MTFELFQHIIVTIVAVAAAVVILRRVGGVVRTPGGASKCSSCPSAAPKDSRQHAAPLTLVRRPDRR
jgi:hypothetical protein